MFIAIVPLTLIYTYLVNSKSITTENVIITVVSYLQIILSASLEAFQLGLKRSFYLGY